jgi:hypothetical protein
MGGSEDPRRLRTEGETGQPKVPDFGVAFEVTTRSRGYLPPRRLDKDLTTDGPRCISFQSAYGDERKDYVVW